MSDILTFVISVLVIFLTGVGAGTFVLGSRIRKVVAEAIIQVTDLETKTTAAYYKAVDDLKKVEAAGVNKLDQIKKVL